MHRSCVSRASELSCLKWSETNWCEEDQVMNGLTFQPKTNKKCTLSHARDKTTWTLDPLVMLAIMLIVDPDSKSPSSEDSFMFPTIRKGKGKKSATTMITELLKSSGKKDSTSHDVRYGALHDIQKNVDIEFIKAVFRGVWTFKGDSCSIRYADKYPGQLEAGKALGGFHNTKEIIPSLDIMMHLDDLLGADATDETTQRFKNFATNLMIRLPFSKEGEQCFSLRNVLLAAIIEMLPKILNDLKEARKSAVADHDDDEIGLAGGVLEKVVRNELFSAHFDWNDLLVWSKKVRTQGLR